MPARTYIKKPGRGAVLSLPYRQHPRYKGVVGHWIMNEGGGTKLYDISGFGNHATMTGMDPATDWVLGQFGPALDFDGSDDIAKAPGPNNLDGGAFSISARVKQSTTGGDSDQSCVVMFANGTTRVFTLLLDRDNSRVCFQTPPRCTPLGTSYTTAGSWTYIAITYPADGVGPIIYIDDAAYTVGNGDVLGTYTDVAIGRYTTATANRPFAGIIDNVRIANRVWTPAEVWSDYVDPFLVFRPTRGVWKVPFTTEYVAPVNQLIGSGGMIGARWV